MKSLVYAIIILVVLSTVYRHLNSDRIESDFDVLSFSELPVQVGGRIKPLDSVARNTLLILSGR